MCPVSNLNRAGEFEEGAGGHWRPPRRSAETGTASGSSVHRMTLARSAATCGTGIEPRGRRARSRADRAGRGTTAGRSRRIAAQKSVARANRTSGGPARRSRPRTARRYARERPGASSTSPRPARRPRTPLTAPSRRSEPRRPQVGIRDGSRAAACTAARPWGAVRDARAKHGYFNRVAFDEIRVAAPRFFAGTRVRTYLDAKRPAPGRADPVRGRTGRNTKLYLAKRPCGSGLSS